MQYHIIYIRIKLFIIANSFQAFLTSSTVAPSVSTSSANGQIALICGILALVVFLIGMYVLN